MTTGREMGHVTPRVIPLGTPYAAPSVDPSINLPNIDSEFEIESFFDNIFAPPIIMFPTKMVPNVIFTPLEYTSNILSKFNWLKYPVIVVIYQSNIWFRSIFFNFLLYCFFIMVMGGSLNINCNILRANTWLKPYCNLS